MFTKQLRQTPLFATLLLLPALLLAGCSGSGNSSSGDAMNILNNVAERYSGLEQYVFQANIHTEITAGTQTQTISMPVTYAADKPGKLHMDVQGENYSMKMVSDGSTTWTYLPQLDEYTVKQASAITPGDEQTTSQSRNVEALAQELTGQYKDIVKNINKAELLREETIDVEGQSYDTYVIKADYNPPMEMDPNNTTMSPTTFWIEKDRHLVVKQQFTVEMSSPRFNEPVAMEQTTTIREVSIGEKPDATLFSFSAPENAKKVASFSTGRQAPTQSEMEGRQAATFELPTLKGNNVSLSDFEGQVVLLDFWATWCAPCRRAHPHIQSVHEEYKDDGLVVLGINNESKRTAEEYMNENNYTFKTLLDLERKVGSKYQVSAIPSVFIIDREGNISSHLVGYQPESSLREALQKAGI